MKPLPHMAPFFSRFPEQAARETRTLTLLKSSAGLPAGEYGFLEFYCNEPTCDCRRVLFQVCRADQPEKVLATINYGWESEDFYTQWLHGDLESAREIINASLDPLNPQSKLSDALLGLFRHVLLKDGAYIERLRRHYGVFKDAQRGSVSARERGAQRASREK